MEEKFDQSDIRVLKKFYLCNKQECPSIFCETTRGKFKLIKWIPNRNVYFDFIEWLRKQKGILYYKTGDTWKIPKSLFKEITNKLSSYTYDVDLKVKDVFFTLEDQINFLIKNKRLKKISLGEEKIFKIPPLNEDETIQRWNPKRRFFEKIKIYDAGKFRIGEVLRIRSKTFVMDTYYKVTEKAIQEIPQNEALDTIAKYSEDTVCYYVTYQKYFVISKFSLPIVPNIVFNYLMRFQVEGVNLESAYVYNIADLKIIEQLLLAIGIKMVKGMKIIQPTDIERKDFVGIIILPISKINISNIFIEILRYFGKVSIDKDTKINWNLNGINYTFVFYADPKADVEKTPRNFLSKNIYYCSDAVLNRLRYMVLFLENILTNNLKRQVKDTKTLENKIKEIKKACKLQILKKLPIQSSDDGEIFMQIISEYIDDKDFIRQLIAIPDKKAFLREQMDLAFQNPESVKLSDETFRKLLKYLK
jgi:hypothetical protein